MQPAHATDDRPCYRLVNEGTVSFSLRIQDQALLPGTSRRLPCAEIDRAHHKSRQRRRIFSSSSSSQSSIAGGITCRLELRDDGLWMTEGSGTDHLLSYADIEDISRAGSTVSSHCRMRQIVVETSYGEYLLQLHTNHERERWYYSVSYKRLLAGMRVTIKSEDTTLESKLHIMKTCADYHAAGKICFDDTRQEFLDSICDYIRDTMIPAKFVKEIVPMLVTTLGSRRPPDSVCQFLRKHMHSIVNTDCQHHLDSLVTELFKLPLLSDYRCGQGEFELLIVYFTVMHQNRKDDDLRKLVNRLHGSSLRTPCPFPSIFLRLRGMIIMSCANAYKEQDEVKKLDLLAVCGLIVEESLQFDDWREKVALLIKPKDFPQQAMKDRSAGVWMSKLVRQLALDDRIAVRLSLTRLSSADSPDWLQHFHIGSPLCADDSSDLFSIIVQSLANVEGSYKRVLSNFASVLESITILAKNNNSCALQALVDMVRHKEIKEDEEIDKIASLLRDGNHLNLHNQLMMWTDGEDQADGPEETLVLTCGSNTNDLREALKSHTVNLRAVDLTSTRCGTEAMRMLTSYPNIKDVRLWSTPINDDSIKILSDKLDLEYLDVRDTQITPTCFRQLGQMKSLKSLHMSGSQYQKHQFSCLPKFLPNLESFVVEDLFDIDDLCRGRVAALRTHDHPIGPAGHTPGRPRRQNFFASCRSQSRLS